MKFWTSSQEMSVFSSVKIFLRLVPVSPLYQKDRYIFGMLHLQELLTLSYILFLRKIL